MSNRAQGSPEFTVVVSFVVLIFLVMMGIVFQKQSDSYNFQVFLDAKKVALALAENVNMISQNGDGYYRCFSMPEKLHGFTSYDLEIIGNFIWINYTGTTWSTQIITNNATILNLAKGENETVCIIDLNGQIFINRTVNGENGTYCIINPNGQMPINQTCQLP